MMDDLINRKSLLQNIVKRLGIKNEDYFTAQESVVISCIYNEPSAQPEQWWIPVTERMPEDGAEVWVTTDMLFEVTRARWHKDTNLWCLPYNSDCLLVLRPIAWMPMIKPQPWEGESDRKNYEYKPKPGQMVRWRCPLWKGEDDADNSQI